MFIRLLCGNQLDYHDLYLPQVTDKAVSLSDDNYSFYCKIKANRNKT